MELTKIFLCVTTLLLLATVTIGQDEATGRDEWIKVTKSTNGTSIYMRLVATESARTKLAWSKYINNPGDEDRNIESRVSLEEYDCEGGLIRTNRLITYHFSGHHSSFDLVNDSSPATRALRKLEAPPPDSVHAAKFKYVCKKETVSGDR